MHTAAAGAAQQKVSMELNVQIGVEPESAIFK
jgi:hypothetical protein